MNDSVVAVETALPAASLAGFWRRVLAFVIDGLILGVIGSALGMLAFDRLAELGVWGRGLGFLISLAYFGVMDSGLARGQTPGKRLLKIRVVRTDGRMLGPGRAALRFCLMGVPYFLNNAHIPLAASNVWIFTLLSLVVFGLGLSILYLLIFNRATRQSLHDLATGSCVIAANSTLGPGTLAHIWRGHYAVVALIAVAALGAPLALAGLRHNSFFKPLLATQEGLMQDPDVAYAGVSAGTYKNFKTGVSQRYIAVTALLAHKLDAKESLGDRLAQVVLNRYPDASGLDNININIVYGFDIGIASASSNTNYSHSPGEWKQRLGGSEGVR